MKKVRTRFAPSPTGYMHIGNLRTALYAYLISKHEDGDFILRIEDTDQVREVEGAVDIIYDVINQTGLAYDEGPDKPGECGPYIQSDRLPLYKEYADKLVELGGAHYCFCKEEEIQAEKDSHEVGYHYEDPCKSISIEEARARIANGEPYTVRQTIPTEGTTAFDDMVYGRIEVENAGLDEGVLLKSDGYPTYNFANIVDDHLMGISHVVRGNEYLSSTPKYNLIYKAFGWTDPIYVHVPPVMKDEFHKLSKRNGDASFQDLRAKGILSDAIINYIALLGWSPEGEQEIFSLEELTKAFSIDRITKSGSIFDFNKLKWMNGVYLRNKDVNEFHELCLPYYTDLNPNYNLFELSKSLQNRVEMLSEITDMIDFVNEPLTFDETIYTHKKMKTNPENSLEALKWVLEEIETVDFSNTDAINQFMMDLAAKKEVKNGRIMWPVRVALSNKAVTPCGAGEIAAIIGKEETIKRLNQAIIDLTK